MMPCSKHVFSAFVLALASTAGGVGIDFEDWSGGGGDQTSIISGGFSFVVDYGAFFVSPDPCHGNPTQSLHTRLGRWILSKADGGAFDITSLDLQEGCIANGSTAVTLTGIGPSGGVVAKELFTLDGFADTYETFYPVAFSNVVQIEFRGELLDGAFSVDNIVVPEASCALFVAAGLGLVRRRPITHRA